MSVEYPDRISEAYDGKFGVAFQEQTQKRIHWMCEHVTGNLVCDVGCSQGIISLLLAKKGKTVCGIDNTPESIQYALGSLKQEDQNVCARLSFVCDDYLKHNFGDMRYDTVILGEVLEHLTVEDRGAFLDKVATMIKNNGKIIITVPLGINYFPDHKQTYYVTELWGELSKRWTVTNVSIIMDQWVGYVATPDEEAEPFVLGKAFVPQLEAALQKIDAMRMEQLKRKEKKLKDLKKSEEELNELIGQKDQELYKLTEQLENALLKVDTLSMEQQTLKEKTLKKLRKDNEELSLLVVQKDQELNKLAEQKEEELNKLTRQKEEALSKLTKQLSLLLDEHQSLSAKYKEQQPYEEFLKDKCANLEKHLSDVKEKLFQEQDLHQQLNKEFYLLNGRYEDQTRSLLELQAQHNTSETMVQTLSLKQNDLKRKFTDMQKQVKIKDIENKELKKRYEILAKSKLGRLTLFYWEAKGLGPVGTLKKVAKKSSRLVACVRAFRKARALGLVGTLKKIAKKSRYLVAAVRSFRGKKKEAREALAAGKKTWLSELFIRQLQPKYDMKYYDRVKQMVENMPKSNGSKFYGKLPLRIGWITDEILYDAFKGSAMQDVILTPEEYPEQIKNIDVLIIISGWHGIDNQWPGFAQEQSANRQTMKLCINACKERDIPVIFYSCEDPPNYQYFIGLAKCCDYIFTSASEMIPQYKEDCGHDCVWALTYGVNPRLHNPVGSRKYSKQKEVLFAGSWMTKYPEREKDIQIIFDGVLKAGKRLQVIDRNLLLKKPQYQFPEKYAQYIAPPVEHEQLQSLQKLYDWAININSVKTSPTMCANRTYEMQACGINLISNYSVSVNSLQPLIYTCQHSEEIPAILNSMSEEEVYTRQMMGVRFAYNGHTCFDQLVFMLEKASLKVDAVRRKVAVVVEEAAPEIIASFNNQTYPDKEIVQVGALHERWHDFDAIAFWSPHYAYGDFYLEDMMNGFKYTASDYVTKDAYYNSEVLHKGIEHDYVANMPDKYRTVFWRKSFSPKTLLEMNGAVKMPNGYSIDHFELNMAKGHIANKGSHSPKLSVIVPVFNNGLHLYGKAFSSLRRSSIFKDMEIMLIDDGSIDKQTYSILRLLEKTYSNVKVFCFNDGGSGSASRPRNKGFELSTAPYVTYLDPDNEAINDAYARMHKCAMEQSCDLVIGDMIKFDEKEHLMGYYRTLFRWSRDGVINSNKNSLLRDIAFMAMSIQAMVFVRSLVSEASLKQVEGAIGEDSLFGWQLLLNSKRIKVINCVAHIYYGSVSGSSVNTVNRKFYDRSYLLEVAQKKWLLDVGLLGAYMRIRFENFFIGWYLKKLSSVVDRDRKSCLGMLAEIYNLYADLYHGNNPKIEAFRQECKECGISIK